MPEPFAIFAWAQEAYDNRKTLRLSANHAAPDNCGCSAKVTQHSIRKVAFLTDTPWELALRARFEAASKVLRVFGLLVSACELPSSLKKVSRRSGIPMRFLLWTIDYAVAKIDSAVPSSWFRSGVTSETDRTQPNGSLSPRWQARRC
jgi:hypothetical protein